MTDTRSDTTARGPLDRPIFDWLLVGIVVLVVLRFTPLVELFTAADEDGQRSAMSSISSLLANVAAFGVAAVFAYAALDNPTTRKVRARWGGHLSGVFLRGLALMFLTAAVCGICAVTVPHPAGAIVFLIALLIGFAKLLRLLLVVAVLLMGQRSDTKRQLRPVPRVRDDDPEDQPA